MDFGKFTSGVIAFSTFLVGHATWLALSAYSIWVALGNRVSQGTSSLLRGANEWLQDPLVQDIVVQFGLKPLLPALVVFALVFLLHAHRRLLRLAGSYIPPELVWHYMPGLRDIDAGRWVHVLGKLGDRYSLADLRDLVQTRYSDALGKRGSASYSDAFAILKALAFLNVVLFAGSLFDGDASLQTVVLSIGFTVGAIIAALLQIYHSRNQSYWAIGDVMSALAADSATMAHIDARRERSPERRLSDQQAAEDLCKSERATPLCTLSWSLPLLGNMRIARERIRFLKRRRDG